MCKQIRLLFLALTFLFYPINAQAWNDERTHQDLSEKATEYSVLGSEKGDYLKNLGLNKNLGETFTLNGETKKVREWIRYGSLEEDAGSVFTAYYYNHFHNPLALSWDQAGLKSYYPWINGISSLLWAQDSSNEWSWQKARGYYYSALTSQTETDRSSNFAKTFKGLGHIIHLIQDVAQPAHVRNDPHPLDDWGIVPQFENWAKDQKNEPIVSSFMSNPVFPTFTNQRLTDFWDTDQYNGTNPSNSNSIGLSEYTNANFFSEETIFSGFTYPQKEDTEYYEEYMKDWGLFKVYRKYLKKIAGGEQIQHFVYAGRLYKYLDASPMLQTYTLGLDEQCYNNYAQKLLPRAVGYSASLINYFFRGQINMEEDPNNSSLYIIKNEYNEDMSGTFTLYYDDINDNRRYLTSWNKSINPNSQSDSVYFTEPVSPEPKEKGKYILVFQGTLGNETDDAVVGRVVKVEECIKPEEVEIIYENGILQMKDCEGKWKSIYTVGCIPSEEPIQAVKKRDNTSSFVVTSWYQNYRMYIVEVTDEIENKDGLLFRKLNCSLSGNYIGSSDTWTKEYSSDITSSGGYGLVDITISYTSTSNSTGSISYSVTRKANGEWSFIQTTEGISSSTSFTTRVLKTPVLDAPQSWYDKTLMWYYPGDGYGESATSCLYETPIRCYFSTEGLGEFYSAILGSPSASETETGKQMIGGSTSIDLFTGETISYTAPSETSSCRNREVGEARPPLYNNFGSYLPNDIQSEQFCDWTTCPTPPNPIWLSISVEDKKRIMIQQYGKIISSMMGDQYRYNDPRRVPWQNCP